MLKSKTARTGTAALILVGALGFGPGLVAGAVAAPDHRSAKATKTSTMQGQAWSFAGTWTDKKGRTGDADRGLWRCDAHGYPLEPASCSVHQGVRHRRP